MLKETVHKSLLGTFNLLSQDHDPEEIEALQKLAKPVLAKKGTELIRRGEIANVIYVVVDGEVEIRIPGKTKKELLIYTAHQNEIVGWSSLVEPGVYSANAYATLDSRLLAFETHLLILEMQKLPSLGYAIMSSISQFLAHRLVNSILHLSPSDS